MKTKLKIGIGLALLIAGTAYTQDSGKTYIVTEIQGLKLQVKHDKAVIAKKDLDIAQANFNGAVEELKQESISVRKENKWPDDLVFDLDTLLYSTPKPVEKPKPEPKK